MTNDEAKMTSNSASSLPAPMSIGTQAGAPLRLKGELDRCAKCGQCRSVCPVFAQLKDESLVSRGRIAVLSANSQDSKRFREIINTCLMCLRCETNCPSLVKTSEIFKAARAELADRNGLPILLRLGFRYILPHRWLYNLAMRLMRIFSPVAKVTLAPIRHLPLALGSFHNRIPNLAKVSALQSLSINRRPNLSVFCAPARPDVHRGARGSAVNKSPSVAIFIGCAINYIYHEVFTSMIDVLKHHGITPIVPKDQVCCGLPALLSGDVATARKLALNNQVAFADADIILTGCSSCGRMLAEEYPSLTADLPADLPAKALAQAGAPAQAGAQSKPKIMDVMEFCLSSPHPVSRIPYPTFYHRPCHSNWNNSPEAIKSFLHEVSDYQENGLPDLCCGGGGLFSFKYPALSEKIGDTRMVHLHRQKGENILVTNCPGCMMQLEFLIRKEGIKNIKVKHAIAIYNEAMRPG
ncbi:MAG: (Fe-S)-binding protein [Planctomycetes bacterium]|nr:(Fe-S)-binding protein [Planctomycetota bacterium]